MNAQREPRGCTEEEANRLTPYVVNAVVFTAVLNGILYDFADALKEDRTMNDTVKKVVRMLHKSAGYAHNEIYRVFNNEIKGFGVLYNKRYDATTEAIERHVGMSGGERYYNIVLALLRLIEKNNTACGKYRSPALKALERFVPRLIETKLPYDDKGEVIERIIESASREVIELHRFKKILKE
jgi:hypothetical protein